MSHDGVNRFLLREKYTPEDLFHQVKNDIDFIGGILSNDDTVVEKLYSQVEKAELIDYFWSGKHHKTIKGVNLITLYYTDIHGTSVPINSEVLNVKKHTRKIAQNIVYFGLNIKI